MQADRSGLKWGGGGEQGSEGWLERLLPLLTICFHTNQIKMFLAKN